MNKVEGLHILLYATQPLLKTSTNYIDDLIGTVPCKKKKNPNYNI